MTAQNASSASLRLAQRSWLWLVIEGALIAALGLAAAALPGLAGLAAALVFGWVLLFAGVLGVAGLFGARGHAHPVWRGISAALTIIAGALVLWLPLAGTLTIAMLVAAYLLLNGMSSIAVAFHHRGQGHGGWGWPIFSGIIGILLALYIVALQPLADAVLVGFLVAVQLVVGGIALVALGLAVRRAPDSV